MRSGRKPNLTMEAYNRAVTVLVDFKSAFDTIDHNMALDALKRIGVEGHELRWIRNFLIGKEDLRKGERNKKLRKIQEDRIPVAQNKLTFNFR
jgi:hypothetical protein